MKCVIDGETDIETGQVCRRCEQRETDRLADIVRMHAMLAGLLEPGSATGQRVSGSRETPLPLRVDVLDLSLPARVARITANFADQLGELSVASVLDSWVRDWIGYDWCPGEHLPSPPVASLAGWLTIRMPDAVRHHPAIDEYSAEIRALWYALRRAVGESEPPRELCIGVPCRNPDCDLKTLYRDNDGSGSVRCGSCGYVLDAEDYTNWVRLNAAAVAA